MCFVFLSSFFHVLFFSLAIVWLSPHVNEVIRVWHFIDGRLLDSRLPLGNKVTKQVTDFTLSMEPWASCRRLYSLNFKLYDILLTKLRATTSVIFTWTYAKVLVCFSIRIYPFYFEKCYINKIFTTVLIWIHNLNYFFFSLGTTNNNLLYRIYCENVIVGPNKSWTRPICP